MTQHISQKTAQQIISTIKDICGHDINFIDEKGIIFASTNASRIGDFHEIGKKAVTTRTTIEVGSGDSFYGTQAGVNIPIVYKGEVIAAVGISGLPEEVRKFAHLAERIASLLLREHDLDVQQNTQKNQSNYIIRALIHGETISHDYLLDFLNDKQITEKDSMHVILIRLSQHYNLTNIPMIEQKIQYLAQSTSSLYTFNYPDDYILLFSDSTLRRQLYLLEKLADTCSDMLTIGIGDRQTIYHLSESYQHAQLALQSLNGRRSLAQYDELDIEMILNNIDISVKEQYIAKTIGALSEKDRQLLEVYYRNNMSLKSACEELYIHKNTLQYQLDRITKLCGYNPRTFQEAAVLYYALLLR